MRNKGVWTKQWCVLQKDKLHLFRRPDEVVPTLSIPLRQCEVRRGSKKTKKFCFELNVPSEKEDFCFAADTEKEMLSWIRWLRAVVEEAEATNRFVPHDDCCRNNSNRIIVLPSARSKQREIYFNPANHCKAQHKVLLRIKNKHIKKPTSHEENFFLNIINSRELGPVPDTNPNKF